MSDTSSAPKVARRPRGRSPSYPAISLPRALERAERLYDLEKQYPTPVASIVDHWGYASLNGPASLSLAAMKKYGLLTDEGSKEERRVQLTDLAVEILNHPDESVRREKIRQAALTPAIHRAMWDEFGRELPSQRNLVWELTKERNFTESGARDFIREYQETIAFAQLETPAQDQESAEEESADWHDEDLSEIQTSSHLSLDQSVEDLGPSESGYPQTQKLSHASSTSDQVRDSSERLIALPLPTGGSFGITGDFPISEIDWAYVMNVLNAMKPGLVKQRLT